MNARVLLLLCALPLITFTAGCEKKHRPLEEIEEEKRNLPTLYLTHPSRKRVIAPSSRGVHVDEATGEIAYQPYECTNPDCPGRTPEGNYQFVHPDVLLSVGPSGEIVYGSVPQGVDYEAYVKSKGGHMTPTCPKCLEIRDLKNETDEQRKQYQNWVQSYQLPDTIERREELEKEYQAAFEARQRRRQGE